MMGAFSECYVSAFGAMASGGPRALQPRVQLEAKERGLGVDVSLQALGAYLSASSPNDLLRKTVHLAISKWDVASDDESWTAAVKARSKERRQLVYQRLGVDDPEVVAILDDLFPVEAEAAVVISETFEPWYTGVRETRGQLYYSAYAEVLARKKWSPEALAALDEATTQVVERLTDPQRIEARQAKGLVVGYVQSGKTANFTGVIAKAIDAGYRLIIVLTGTIDVLRRQTQRRLDMELVGKENILRGVDPTDPDVMSHVDYQDDVDWDTKFHSFGFLPSSRNQPDIIRLTSAKFDYKSLKAGIVALEFEKVDRTKALFAAVNLPQSSARIVVVKKNKAVLTKFVRDLKSIKTPLHEIPTLIVDDESDQASVNTSDPQRWKQGVTERSAINKLLSQLLGLLPRAQYVGYTATPFANVFVDPSDADDIFPRDFLLSLQRPIEYMGVSDFHDLDNAVDESDRTIANSNEKAFVRDAVDGSHDGGEPKLQECVDAFVLGGAIKLYREAKGEGSYRHHTMLLHASVKQVEHAALAGEIRSIWTTQSFTGLAGLARLKKLYLEDFLPVCEARSNGFGFPANFDDLHPFIAQSVARIGTAGDPVLIVNGDKEMASEEIDFDRRQVWRILVGGTKLSRGFTVEGLTVSYYRRKTSQADTLMQMGRWFGFRPGYRDLVRLYIGRAESEGGGRTLDLYQAFEAIVRDEEAFRQQLRQYSVLVDGRPQITPRDIPPLVSQHLPWLRPAARNKMFNAELVVRRTTGSLVIPTGYPIDDVNKGKNYLAVRPLIQRAMTKVDLVTPAGENVGRSSFKAWIGEVESHVFLTAIESIIWVTPDYYAPDKAFLRELGGRVKRWIVIVPQTADEKNVRLLPDVGPRTVFKRDLKPPSYKLWGEPTDRKHRPSAQFVTQNIEDYGDPALAKYRAADVGAVLVYPMAPAPSKLPERPSAEQIVLAVAWITPAGVATSSQVVQFRVRNSALAAEPIVSVDA
ncbi:MAG TPA: Z1 domain-containing protein [Polyangiaceae bacterium]|nr:Z1 domain-containing protein [Polyangiaceae bacterium]